MVSSNAFIVIYQFSMKCSVKKMFLLKSLYIWKANTTYVLSLNSQFSALSDRTKIQNGGYNINVDNNVVLTMTMVSHYIEYIGKTWHFNFSSLKK